MKHKIFEIRDSGTMFLVLCVDMNPAGTTERLALRRYGYPCDGRPNILMTHLTGDGHATNDPWGWGGSSTYQHAHHYIIDHWGELQTGDVVDVEFIRGTTTEKKVSDVWPNPPSKFEITSDLIQTLSGMSNCIPREPEVAKLAILSMLIYVAATISRQPEDSKEYMLSAFSWGWDSFNSFADDYEKATGKSAMEEIDGHAS